MSDTLVVILSPPELARLNFVYAWLNILAYLLSMPIQGSCSAKYPWVRQHPQQHNNNVRNIYLWEHWGWTTITVLRCSRKMSWNISAVISPLSDGLR